MNAFVFFQFVFSLVLIAPSAYPQRAIKSTDSNYTGLASDRWSLNKHLWSYAKYKIEKNDKPIIDFNAIDNWQKMGDYLSVSPNGKYFAYTIERGNDYNRKVDSLIVQPVDDSWREVFVEAKPICFTDDSKQYVFEEGTALCFFRLDGNQPKYVKNVASYKKQNKGRNEWLAYQLKADGSNVVLLNLVTGKEKVFSGISDYKFDNSNDWFICESGSNSNRNESKEILVHQLATGIEKRFSFVVDYLFSENGKAILFKTVEEVDNRAVTALEYASLPEGRGKIIWAGKDNDINVNNYSVDKLGGQVVFSIRDSGTGNLANNSIWYYKRGMDNAILKVANEAAGIGKDLQIEGSAFFTDNGRYIQFLLQPKPSLSKVDPDAVQLDVWNHKDLVLQSAQADQLNHPKKYNSIVNVENGQIIQLESEGRTLHLLQGDFAIVKKLSKDTYGDRFWENGYGIDKDSNWLVSLNDGRRHLLGSKDGSATEIGPFWFSPSGNYLVYFDVSKGCHYFSYDLRTGKLRDITAYNEGRQLGHISRYLRTSKPPEQPAGLAAWLENDAGVLVYDNNDIWQFDLQGRKPAINLTNGFGRSHGIIFSLFNSQRFDNTIPVLTEGGFLLLRAFNTNNKYSGFYRRDVGVDGDPEVLYMGPYFTNMIPWCQDPNLSGKGVQPIKARDVNVWIVQRQSDAEAPNYYRTSDFKFFEKLTNLQPQKGYNWLSEELHTFKHLDGKKGQGILYKPENFDSTKRYPVLIAFYGGYSDNLYQFPVPAYNKQAITPGVSPIWFLNNGYLIFTPDIYVTPLKYGPEAFNVIEGAVRYLKQLPYVDGSKLGCCSHSWSAKLGSYIMTHSQSFSAIAISEGFLYANMINTAFSADENGVSRLEDVEEGFQFGNLWENKDSWLDQTTVLNVNNVNTSLLLLCNKGSSKDYQNQTLQLFTALRRLEKKVWWLKYDKGTHNLSNIDERKDFTIRYTQFFDHYLKEAPAPRWMTHGIRAAMKGIETGYELDPAGSCGAKENKCKVCEKWNEQYRKTPEMFNKPISEWQLDKTTKQVTMTEATKSSK
jgi:dipeptidyl aminopeptidase/acylaminoacyl peptidase